MQQNLSAQHAELSKHRATQLQEEKADQISVVHIMYIYIYLNCLFSGYSVVSLCPCTQYTSKGLL